MLGGDFIKNKVGQFSGGVLRRIEGILDRIDESRESKGRDESAEDELLASDSSEDQTAEDKKRENLRRNFLKKDPEHDQEVQNISMESSQGVPDHSGSAYNGPGNVDHEKVDSNMAQRNFDNHRGN